MANTNFSGVSLEGIGQFSARTLASVDSLNDGEFGFIFQASGVSIALRSGSTAYICSGTTAAAASLLSQAIS